MELVRTKCLSCGRPLRLGQPKFCHARCDASYSRKLAKQRANYVPQICSISIYTCQQCGELACRKAKGRNPAYCRKPECRRAWNAARMRKFFHEYKAREGEDYQERYGPQRRAAAVIAARLREARMAGLPSERIVPRLVFKRDKWRCQICLRRIEKWLVHPDPFSGSVDHIVPISKGGAHLYSNVQATHLICNKSKGARDEARPELVLAIMLGIVN